MASDDGKTDSKHLWHIHGVDYDLRAFVRLHPGGKLAIRLGQGIDTTNLFESYHRPGAAMLVLEQHRVDGCGDNGRGPLAIHACPFKQDLDEVVRRHFAGRGCRAHKATTSHWLICGAFFAVELCCWAGWARGSWTATALLPVFFWLCAVNMAHDASHFAFSSIPWVNELFAMTAMPLIYEPITWYYQHVISHHTHTNEVDMDVDLSHFVPLKLHAQDTRSHPAGTATLLDFLKVVNAGLHLAIWVPINCSGLIDDATYRQQYDPAIQMPRGLAGHRKYRRRILLAPALVLAMATFAISCHGIGVGLLLLTTPFAGASLLFVLNTQVSHIQPEVQLAEAELVDKANFFKLQASTSVDYSTSSHLWRLLSGGLNTQALHHCLPYVSSCHYTELYPAFAACCKRHGVTLHTRRSFFHAVTTSARHVWKLNRDSL